MVFVGKRCYSGLFDILSASFHGHTRLDAKLQIEGAFWFLHHHNYCGSGKIQADLRSARGGADHQDWVTRTRSAVALWEKGLGAECLLHQGLQCDERRQQFYL